MARPAAAPGCSAPYLSQTSSARAPLNRSILDGRVVLVLPFDNRSGQTNLAWIGDSFPDTLNQRLTSAGFLTITRDDRQYALDHLGLPVDFKPSRATTIRIAQTLDADFVIVGSYNVSTNGRRIAVTGAGPRGQQTAHVRATRRLEPNSPASSTSRTPSPGRSPARSIPTST